MKRRGMTKFSMTMWAAVGTAALLALGDAAFAQAPAGVTAAVNPQATGTPPAGTTRVLEVGGNVVQNEHLTTGPEGQAQLLFRDGSTMTMGPDSDLTIDNFVYDPDKKTAQLAMTAAVGVFRFVGGRASKDEPVILNTPTSTIGIRGGIAVHDSRANQTHFLHGQGLTVTSKTTNQTVTARQGFTITLGPGGTLVITKIDIAALARISASFQGRPGAGGGGTSPNQDSPGARGVAGANSGQPAFLFGPPPGSLITGGVFNAAQFFTNQLVTQTGQAITTGTETGGGGSFPLTLSGYNIAYAGPSIFGGGGASDNNLTTYPTFNISFSSSFTSGNQTFNTVATTTQSSNVAVNFTGSGVPASFTWTSSQSGSVTTTCTGSGCPAPQTFPISSVTYSTTSTIANANVTELGGDSFIRFARLTGGQVNIQESSGSTGFIANTSFPFVIGVPATQLPTSGQFNYSLMGATSPVYINGSGTPGAFTGSMSILFAPPGALISALAGASLVTSTSNGFPAVIVGLSGTVTMPGDGVYSFQTTGGLTNLTAQLASGATGTIYGFGPSFNGSISFVGPNGGRACSSSCIASLSGFLAGPGGVRAGLAYVIGTLNGSNPFGPNSIIGVAAFKR